MFHVVGSYSRREREIDAWQAITQMQRERIIVEISDLVHRQLVTSALESDFRRHLEQNVLVILRTFFTCLKFIRYFRLIEPYHARCTCSTGTIDSATSCPATSNSRYSCRRTSCTYFL